MATILNCPRGRMTKDLVTPHRVGDAVVLIDDAETLTADPDVRRLRVPTTSTPALVIPLIDNRKEEAR